MSARAHRGVLLALTASALAIGVCTYLGYGFGKDMAERENAVAAEGFL